LLRYDARVAMDDEALATRLAHVVELLRPLYDRPPPVQPGDWLDVHEETHQSFDAYRESGPARALGDRRRIDIVPIGLLPAAHDAIVAATIDLLTAVFGLSVRRAPAFDVDAIPARARRRSPGTGQPQLLTSWLRERALLPRVDGETAVVLGLTTIDLWPGPGWNFVFGEASLRERVGVWSMARFGDPVRERERCLRRTLGTATHETAHMFSVPHCMAFACLMGGSNSLDESDERPLWLCPECLAKVCWATRRDPAGALRATETAMRRAGFDAEARFLARSLEAIDA
jgi:archaemetzincin